MRGIENGVHCVAAGALFCWLVRCVAGELRGRWLVRSEAGALFRWLVRCVAWLLVRCCAGWCLVAWLMVCCVVADALLRCWLLRRFAEDC